MKKNQGTLNFELINLEDLTNTPSPNYNITLQRAQQIALEMKCPPGTGRIGMSSLKKIH
ncbi:MAG: hypothetical protein AB2L24_33465 [Mangrovibacterium sp.]